MKQPVTMLTPTVIICQILTTYGVEQRDSDLKPRIDDGAPSEQPPALSVDHTYAASWWPLSDDCSADDVSDDDTLFDVTPLDSDVSTSFTVSSSFSCDVTADDVTGLQIVLLDHNYCLLPL